MSRSATNTAVKPPISALSRDAPLQLQIFQVLRSEIEDGLWHGMADFPTEKELASRFQVSAITSRAVLDRLKTEGWIERGRGRRSTARYSPAANLQSSGEEMLPVGPSKPYDYKVIFADTRVAPADACMAFDLPNGSSLWQCNRLRFLGRTPHSVTHNAQLEELGLTHDPRDLAKMPMVEILQQAGHEIGAIRRRIAAVPAPQFVAEQLKISLNVPLLRYTFTIHTAEGQLLEWVRIYLSPSFSSGEEVFDIPSGHWYMGERM
jgi:GntR family transcriptional regulator